MEKRGGLIPKAKSKAADENVSQLFLEASEQVESLCTGYSVKSGDILVRSSPWVLRANAQDIVEGISVTL